MNLEQLRWRTRELVGLQETDDATNPDEVDRFVNEAYLQVCGMHPEWPFRFVTQTINVTAGTVEYALTPPMRMVRTAYIASDTTHGPLHRRRLHDIEALDHVPTDTPTDYALRDDTTLVVFPEPDAGYAVTVHGVQSVTELTDDSDEPIFDAEYHPVVPYLAAASYADALGDQRAEKYRVQAGGILRRMERDYLGDHDEGMVQMGSRRTYRFSSQRPYPWREL